MTNDIKPNLVADDGSGGGKSSQPQSRTKSMKTKLNLGRRNIEQKVTLGTNIKNAMTGNDLFTTPNPTMADYGAAVSPYWHPERFCEVVTPA